MNLSTIARLFAVIPPLFVVMGLSGCASEKHYTTSVVDYLYPAGHPVVVPDIPTLRLPLRVGIAFVPQAKSDQSRRESAPYTHAISLTPQKRIDLMRQVAEHFKKYPYVKSIEIIPSAYLTPSGSFTNLDQIRAMFGVDVIALLSYDQVQFTDEDTLSLSYWTIIGAYLVPAEKNDTHTMVDAVVYDIASRKMLFRAPGISRIKGRAAPVNLPQKLRRDSEAGFEQATTQMIANLDQQLALFKDKVKTAPQEYKVVHGPGYTGGGSLDGWMLAIALRLTAGAFLRRRRP